MPGVRAFASLVGEQIDQAETRRAFDLRLLRYLRDIHRRANTACAGLAGLVHAQSREEKELGGNAGRHTGTHQSREKLTRALCALQKTAVVLGRKGFVRLVLSVPAFLTAARPGARPDFPYSGTSDGRSQSGLSPRLQTLRGFDLCRQCHQNF